MAVFQAAGSVRMEAASGKLGMATFTLLRGTVGPKEEWWSVVSKTDSGGV